MNQLKMTCGWLRAKLGAFAKEEHGGGEIIAVVVVIAIVIVLGLLFQQNITDLFNSMWGNVTSNADKVGK